MSAEASPLVDPQGRAIDYLRISVTDRCNYRCSYCVPADGATRSAREEQLSFEEIAALAKVFVGLGVRRVRLTGGEPTVRRDLPTLVRMLRAIDGLGEIALSTNGHLLAELAAPLRSAGVDRLNVSLDSLDPAKFERITRGGDLPRVLAGLEAARGAQFRVDQVEHGGHPGLQRRRGGRHLPLCLGARSRPAVHRRDADGGRTDLPARRLPGSRRDSRARRARSSRGRASSRTREATRVARDRPAIFV